MPTNPLKQSPVAVIGSLAAATMTALSVLVAHGVIPSSLAKSAGPWVVLAVVGGYFLLTWFHVTPWLKAEADRLALTEGRLPDADHARILAGVADAVREVVDGAEHVTGADHPDAEAIGAPEAPSANAGSIA